MQNKLNMIATTPINTGPDDAAPLSEFDTVFSNVVYIVIALAGIVFFLLLLSGGFKWLTSSGDPKALESAKKTLTYAIGGLILIASTYLIFRFIYVFTGVDVLNFSIVR